MNESNQPQAINSYGDNSLHWGITSSLKNMVRSSSVAGLFLALLGGSLFLVFIRALR